VRVLRTLFPVIRFNFLLYWYMIITNRPAIVKNVSSNAHSYYEYLCQVSREIGVNRKNGRTDGQPQHTMLSVYYC